ncbi:MAG: hypothetical protein ACLVJ4_01695 [Mediterraneibacter sp.]
MDKIIIFYDDTRPGCCRIAAEWEKAENVECRKASEYLDKTFVFATNARIGLVSESENGKIPYIISHIIWRLVGDKNGQHMILVSGGRRELKAIRTAINDMAKRGYHVRYIYTRYMLEKYKIKEEDAVHWILNDMETEQLRNDIKEKYENMSRKERMKELRHELRSYRKYHGRRQ